MKPILFALLLSLSLHAYQVGDKLPQEMLNKLSIKDEKTYIVSFFASWCGSCKKELPLLAKLNSTLDKSKHELIGIDIDKNLEDGIKFQKERGVNFRVINDTQKNIVSKFKPIGMPSLYYVKNEKVVSIITGAVDDIDIKISNDLKEME